MTHFHPHGQKIYKRKFDAFVQQINAGWRFALGRTKGTEALLKLNYISQSQPTWAAMLLFAKEPLRHHIHIGRFKSPSLIIDDRQITDTLFEAVDQAMRFIISYVPVVFEITGAVPRIERFAYPLPALREALLNAVVHRDYKDGSDIQIKIFDSSISIFSPGRLYDGLTLTELQHDHYRSRLRNKLVAEAFYLTTGIEKYGSGFIRIRQSLLDYPEVQFTVEELSGGLCLTFTKPPLQESEGLNEGLNQGVSQLLSLIQKQPGLRTTGLAAQLNTSPKTIERWLKQLKDQGYIEFRGASKTGGYHPKPNH